MRKLRTIMIAVLAVAVLFLVGCTTNSTGNIGQDILNAIINIGSLSWLGITRTNAVESFMRVMIAVLIFALLFEGSKAIGLPRNAGIVLTLILSIIVAIFFPPAILAAIGTTYATIVAFLLIGIPIAACFWAYYQIPNTYAGNWGRLGALLLALYVLWVIKNWAGTAGLSLV